jgi:hypothetical protein
VVQSLYTLITLHCEALLLAGAANTCYAKGPPGHGY